MKMSINKTIKTAIIMAIIAFPVATFADAPATSPATISGSDAGTSLSAPGTTPAGDAGTSLSAPGTVGGNNAGTPVPAAPGTVSGSNAGTPTPAAPSTVSGSDAGIQTPAPAASGNPAGSITGGSVGSSVSGGGSSVTTVTTGSLGTSTLPCPALTGYVLPGRVNNSSDISKLQLFLNVSEHAGLTQNSILDTQTVDAIKNFQAKYLRDIMGPWGATAPTGQVYITTLKKINSISCGTEVSLNTQDQQIINSYKTQTPRTENTVGAGVTPKTVTKVKGTSVSGGASGGASTSETVGSNSTSTGSDNSALVGNAISSTNKGFFSKIFSTIANWFR